jgi:hypothetical protein
MRVGTYLWKREKSLTVIYISSYRCIGECLMKTPTKEGVFNEEIAYQLQINVESFEIYNTHKLLPVSIWYVICA